MANLKFKAWMAENGVKQADLTELLGLSAQSVWKKVNGKEPFSIQQISTICFKYGISADIFVLNELQTCNAEGGNNAEN